MSELNHKLDQLKLCSMCQELNHVLTDAATKNLSHAETIEWLADIELDGRRSRSVERRFHMSKLQTKVAIALR